jgi:hypothetical protein
MILYKPYVHGKHIESILGTCKNMTKKVFNLNNTIPHSVRLVNFFGSRPSGVRPRLLPKPPHNTSILLQILSSSLQQSPSPRTLTRTATGFNIDWKGGNVIANKKKIKEIEQAKKSCRESVSVGMTHALEILGESICVHPVCLLFKRVGTSQSVQTSWGFLCPQHSKSIEKGMPPPPQHKYVKQPQGEPPQS